MPDVGRDNLIANIWRMRKRRRYGLLCIIGLRYGTIRLDLFPFQLLVLGILNFLYRWARTLHLEHETRAT
jgi:hypothetical protein